MSLLKSCLATIPDHRRAQGPDVRPHSRAIVQHSGRGLRSIGIYTSLPRN
jgi:hypothetical protein